MNRNEAIDFFRLFYWRSIVHPIKDVEVLKRLEEASAALGSEVWMDHPPCPGCGTFLQGDLGDWTCPKCEKHFIVEEAYRVVGPDEERNRFTEELRALATTKVNAERGSSEERS